MTTALTNNGALGCPPSLQSLKNLSEVDAIHGTPFRRRHGLSKGRYVVIVAAISSLLRSRRPSAIIGRVRTIVIDAVKRVLQRWARSHVIVEVEKIVLPALAHRDSSTSVKREGLRSRVFASISSFSPNVVFSLVRQASLRRGLIDTMTAATFRATVSERPSSTDYTRAAIAATNPFPVRGSANHHETPESLSCHIDKLHCVHCSSL